MSNRFDEIFSLGRLRRAWRETPGDEASGNVFRPSAGAAVETYVRLTLLISERFSGEELETLSVFTDELGELIARRYPGVDVLALAREASAQSGTASTGGGGDAGAGAPGGPTSGEEGGEGDVHAFAEPPDPGLEAALIDAIEDMLEALEFGGGGR